MNDTTTGRQAAAVLAELGWPTGVPTERLAASVFDRAVRSGMFESELILGYTFDRAKLPGWATREDRLMVALHALCRFAADRGRLEELRFDGALVFDEVRSDGWTRASPTLPGTRGPQGAGCGVSREPESQE